MFRPLCCDSKGSNLSKVMMLIINICTVCATASFSSAGYKLQMQLSHKIWNVLLQPFVSNLMVFLPLVPCRPLSYRDAAMHGRCRPFQPGGAAAHPQTAGWRQRWRNRGQWECRGELWDWTFTVWGGRKGLSGFAWNCRTHVMLNLWPLAAVSN